MILVSPLLLLLLLPPTNRSWMILPITQHAAPPHQFLFIYDRSSVGVHVHAQLVTHYNGRAVLLNGLHHAEHGSYKSLP